MFTLIAAAPDAPVEYQISLAGEPGAISGLIVEMRFRGEADGMTHLRLPDQWAQETEYWTGLVDLEAEGAALEPGDRPDRYVLSHAPGAEVRLRYRVIQDWEGLPRTGMGGNPYRPVVQPDYVHAVGHAVFAALADETWALADIPVTAHLVEPEGEITLVSDAPAARDREALRDSIIVGGDFTVIEHPVGADRVRFAWRGEPVEDTPALAAEVLEMMTGHNAFWGDAPDDYLVTVLPLTLHVQGARSMGGTGLDDAFAFFISPGHSADRIARTLRHEYLHTWIPIRMGAARLDSDLDFYTHTWFSEGFTDFYTWRLGVREGAIEQGAAIEELNAMLDRYARSPAATVPADAITRDLYWGQRPVQDLPYKRGFIVALALDHAIRAATAGASDLDDVMRAAHAATQAGGDLPPPEAHVLQLAQTRYGVDFEETLTAMLSGEALAALPADALNACGVFEWREAPIFEVGFVAEQDDDGRWIFTEVDPNGPAYAAGLRVGMQWLQRVSGVRGDPVTPYGLRVRMRDGGEQVITYAPAGRETVRLQQLAVAADLDEQACLAEIAGTGNEPDAHN